jgi:hypothetical protein
VTPTVCILTLCSDLTYLYGTLTTLQTIRTGFPTARVLVCDNGSLPDAQRQIRQAADTAGAQFLQLAPPLSPPLPHWDVLRGLIQDERFLVSLRVTPRSPLVILDGDILFWENCESWQVDGILAGRLVPAGVRGMGEETVLLLPRLHTSFLWIPDRRTLRQRIEDIQATHTTWDPFTPWTIPNPFRSRVWYLGDTASNLYGAVREQCAPFTPSHLDCYDHLFCGSSPANIAELCRSPVPGYDWFPRVHAAAQRGDWSSIRGVWREQEAAYTGTGTHEQG